MIVEGAKSFLRRHGWSRASLSWAFYDWGNSAFATLILAGVFPIFYRDQWAHQLAEQQISFSLALINSISGVLVMLTAPLLGSIADASSARKPLLVVCAFSGAMLTAVFAFIPSGEWLVAAICYVFAVFFFMAGNVFYDAMLVGICRPRDYDQVSAGGYALGYLGGGLLLVFSIGLILRAGSFGVEEQWMMRVSFILTGVWWAVFTWPLLRYVRERRGGRFDLRRGLQRFLNTVRLLRAHPTAAWFLLAYWLYIDAVDTVIRMAVNYGQVIGFDAADLMLALILVQFVGFPATLVYGWLAHRFGNGRLIIAGIVGYIVICLWGSVIDSLAGFYALAFLIALLQGGLQAQSRAFYARLIPAESATQFFGLYNLLGRFAVVVGPLVLGVVGSISGNLRFGIASVSVLLVAGLFVFCRKVLPRLEPGMR